MRIAGGRPIVVLALSGHSLSTGCAMDGLNVGIAWAVLNPESAQFWLGFKSLQVL